MGLRATPSASPPGIGRADRGGTLGGFLSLDLSRAERALAQVEG
jgi:hypothetical protein